MEEALTFSLVSEVSALETPKSAVLAIWPLAYSSMNSFPVEIAGFILPPVWSDWKSTPDNGCWVEDVT